MKKVTMFDTSIVTTNVGDEIIVDAVDREIRKLHDDAMIFRVPTHEKIGYNSYKIINQSDFAFVAGTNLLSSNFRLIRPNSWRLDFMDKQFIKNKNIILVGVGWSNYQDKPSIVSKNFYKSILSKEYIHSVRDSYTESKLKSIGIDNVINTGCATMWSLTPEFCKQVPQEKAEDVVFTLTDYRVDEKNDQKLIDYLEDAYKNVYFWPQGARDFDYINKLKFDNVEIIPPTLKAFDALLDSKKELEYVGTRLHGGIRALQKKRRTIIIGVDNRAIEKKKDFNLNVLERENIENLPQLINSKFETNIKLDIEKINKWKSQF